jgi:plasmid maintenance system antidote protein VapI
MQGRMTIDEYLEKTGLSACAFAEVAGVSKNSVYRHRNGQAVSYETADRMSAGTGRKVKADLIYRVGRSV